MNKELIGKLDSIFKKYGIKDEKNILGYRDKLIEYVRSLEMKDIQTEYDKKEFLYEFVELQKDYGYENDMLNDYTMIIATSSKNLAQCFTPKCLNELLSKAMDYTEPGLKIFYEPAGGTGSTIIRAVFDWRQIVGFNDFAKLHLCEVDELDKYNFHCCILNFIIRGFNADVKQINTLTQELFDRAIMVNDGWFSKFKFIEGEDINGW